MEMSVKNGAELLDRLVKDIVSESAATYVSMLHLPPEDAEHQSPDGRYPQQSDFPTAFNLDRFLPLLEERINVLNPNTRSFLVAWVTLLDSIPDLELIAHLPRFLGGLFKFLSDTNQDVYTMTQAALDRFLVEIRKIARIKKGIAESKKGNSKDERRRSTSSLQSGPEGESEATSDNPVEKEEVVEDREDVSGESGSISSNHTGKSVNGDGNWIPGQDVHVDHPKILEILVEFLSISTGTFILGLLSSFADSCRPRKGANRDSSDCSSLDRQSFRHLPRRHHAVCTQFAVARSAEGVPRRLDRAQSGGKSQCVTNGLHHVAIRRQSQTRRQCGWPDPAAANPHRTR
jgi:hypothetical protein